MVYHSVTIIIVSRTFRDIQPKLSKSILQWNIGYQKKVEPTFQKMDFLKSNTRTSNIVDKHIFFTIYLKLLYMQYYYKTIRDPAQNKTYTDK